jgi:chromate transporter
MRERSALEVLLTFLKLDVTSFGGPIAHIGDFGEKIVVRRRWINDAAYTDLVALCQFLPGPASSQVGFSKGLIRAGYWGRLAAWIGFTLPSAMLLTAFAYGAAALVGPMGTGVLHPSRQQHSGYLPHVGVMALTTFFVLLVALPVLGGMSQGVELFDVGS